MALAGLLGVLLWLQRTAQAGEGQYCAQVWASFDRTSKWARELGMTLDAAGSEAPDTVAPRLAAIRQGLQDESELIGHLDPPAEARLVQAHALAALGALLLAADPRLLDSEANARQQLGPYLREQVLLARGEARAAAAALRAADEECAARHGPGTLRPLSRRRESAPMP